MEEKAKEAVEKALGEPFGMELGEDLLKTRRNLLLLGAISVFSYSAGLKIDVVSSGQMSALGGVALKGLTHQHFSAALAIVIFYLIIHYAWGSIDLMAEYRLRLTGSRVAHQTGGLFGHEEVDYPPDPRQSTLYTWWRAESLQMKGLENSISVFGAKADQYLAELKLLSEKLQAGLSPPISAQMSSSLTQINQLGTHVQRAASELKNEVGRVGKVVSSMRPTVSLERFDRAYLYYARAHNLKWLFMDFVTPISAGIAGIWAALKMFASSS